MLKNFVKHGILKNMVRNGLQSMARKAKLVHTQVPDADYHDSPDQCAHHNLNIALKRGKTWYTVKKNFVKHGILKKHGKIWFTVNIV